MAEADDPMTPSADYAAMAHYWTMVNAILCGVEALRANAAQASVWGPQVPYANLSQLRHRGSAGISPYLPQYPMETDADYEIRRRGAPLTNIYADISTNLASKPFKEECALDDNEPEDLKKLSEDIDGQGNNLHVFAGGVFKSALDKAIHWILVDHTKVPQGTTLADERDMGARPYWVHIPAERMLAVYSVFFQGKEVFVHARIHEPTCRRVGYKETTVNRVRELNREQTFDEFGNITALGGASYQVLEEVDTNGQKQWVTVESGPITLGELPLVPFVIGERSGTSWRVDPALKNIAHMQITSFQREADLQYAGVKTANPILVGEGIPAPQDGGEVTVPVGPNAVLIAPPGGDGNHGTWKYIEIAATSLNYLAAQRDKLHTEMRDLGMQPLTTANLTVITTANVSMKAHSAVQKWALGLKDALEQAWILTCRWLKQDRSPIVRVYTDFGVDMEAGTELTELNKATWLSDQNKFEEFKRRGAVREDAEWDENEQQIAEQQQGLQPEQPIDPVTGQPIAAPPPDNVIPMPTRKQDVTGAYQRGAQRG